MSKETIKLSVHKGEDGNFFLADQDGREVTGILQLSVHADYQHVTTFELSAIAHDSDGYPHVNRVTKGDE